MLHERYAISLQRRQLGFNGLFVPLGLRARTAHRSFHQQTVLYRLSARSGTECVFGSYLGQNSVPTVSGVSKIRLCRLQALTAFATLVFDDKTNGNG